MKQLRQVSLAFLCLGLGFWLQLILQILRGDHGRVIARDLLDCLPSGRGRYKQGSPLTSEQLAQKDATEFEEKQQLAQKIWKSNVHKRERVFGKNGMRLKGLRTPYKLTDEQKAMWHPSAYYLEYYRPTYPCFEEERLGLWTSDGGWVCRPNRLSSQSVVYTFGSSDKLMAFETEIYHRRQPEVHLFNPTLPAAMTEKLETREEFRFHPLGISDKDYEKHKTLETIMKDLEHAFVDVLRIDCDGCEYRVLKQIMQEEVVPIGQILVSVYRITEPRRTKALLSLMERKRYRMFHLDQDWRRMHVMQVSYIHESLCQPKAEQLAAGLMLK